MKMNIVQAVTGHNILKFQYDGLLRTVEPHTDGIYKSTGNEVLSAYQIGGFSNSGELPGWRLYYINELISVSVCSEKFQVTRSGYNPNDSRMSQIFARA
jgi:hypothetical protein